MAGPLVTVEFADSVAGQPFAPPSCWPFVAHAILNFAAELQNQLVAHITANNGIHLRHWRPISKQIVCIDTEKAVLQRHLRRKRRPRNKVPKVDKVRTLGSGMIVGEN